MTAKPTEKLGKVPLPHPARRPPLPPTRSEIRYSAPSMARFVPARAVGSFVPTLTRKAFEKFGFSTAALITDWAAIAGAEIASYTMPERLKWPRGTANDDGDDMVGERRGATLMLRVDPARALDIEYRSRQIVERINAYFGYRAVEALRIVQAPLHTPPIVGSAKNGAYSPPPCGEGLGVGGTTTADGLESPPPSLPHKGGGTDASTTDPLTAALARLEQGVRRDDATRRP